MPGGHHVRHVGQHAAGRGHRERHCRVVGAALEYARRIEVGNDDVRLEYLRRRRLRERVFVEAFGNRARGASMARARFVKATLVARDRGVAADAVVQFRGSRQAADGDAGVVGLGIAEILDIPAITFACDVQINDGVVTVQRVLQDGIETVEADLPALVTISNELGKVRHASMRETMRAAKKPVKEWMPDDIGLDETQVGSSAMRYKLERLYVPVNDIECEFIGGDTPADIAATLAQHMREAKLI